MQHGKKKIMNKIPVAEIFGPTIQGEGSNVGIKTLFVRVVGCDFNCAWCDSKFAWYRNKNTKIYDDDELSIELIDRCKATNTAHVILTGGNPCLYNFKNVIDKLHEQNIDVDVETQGSKIPNWLNKIDTVVFSPKAPSSKQPDVYENIKDYLETYNLQQIVIKIPVFDDEDFQFAKKYYDLTEMYDNVKMYISVGNTDTTESGDISRRVLDDYEKLINRVMNSEMKKVYVLPQVHTLVWNNKSGV